MQLLLLHHCQREAWLKGLKTCTREGWNSANLMAMHQHVAFTVLPVQCMQMLLPRHCQCEAWVKGVRVCRQGWEGANVGMHEWIQGLMAAFQEAQDQERQARQDHTFQATGDSQQTLLGTHVIKALQVSPHLPFACCPCRPSVAFARCPSANFSCLSHAASLPGCFSQPANLPTPSKAALPCCQRCFLSTCDFAVVAACLGYASCYVPLSFASMTQNLFCPQDHCNE